MEDGAAGLGVGSSRKGNVKSCTSSDVEKQHFSTKYTFPLEISAMVKPFSSLSNASNSLSRVCGSFKQWILLLKMKVISS